MKTRRNSRILTTVSLAVSSASTVAWGDTLYSNMQGNYVAEQTGSITLVKETYDSTHITNTPADSFYTNPMTSSFVAGVGDDYKLGYNGQLSMQYGVVDRYVQMNSITVFGGSAPSSGNPTGSHGATVTLYVYNSNKQRLPGAQVNYNDPFFGVGLHTITFNGSFWIPSNGYVIFVPSETKYVNVATHTTDPYSIGTVSYTAKFGAAPTVGLGNGSTFASKVSGTDGSLALNNPLNPAIPNSPAYMQMSLGGTGYGGMLCDANGDNVVNALDFNALAAGYGSNSPATLDPNDNHDAAALASGDFNFDGVVNGADFTLLSSCYGRSLPQSSMPLGLGAIVPEPGAAVGLAAALLGLRRRRNVARQVV